jgi:hypothetical protein
MVVKSRRIRSTEQAIYLEEMKKCTHFSQKRHLECLGTDGRITLKWISKK